MFVFPLLIKSKKREDKKGKINKDIKSRTYIF